MKIKFQTLKLKTNLVIIIYDGNSKLVRKSDTSFPELIIVLCCPLTSHYHCFSKARDNTCLFCIGS